MAALKASSKGLAAKLHDDEELQWLVEYASEVCGTPISFVSELSLDLQRFREEIGLGISETPLELSFCVHAVKGDNLLEISDATQDSRVRDHPMVRGPEHLRFYAGMPLSNPKGQKVGSFCVMDRRPRSLDDFQRRTLALLARFVELRLALAEAKDRVAMRGEERSRLEEEAKGRARRLVDGLPCGVGVVDRTYRVVSANDTLRTVLGDDHVVDARLQALVDFALERGEARGDTAYGSVRCVKDTGGQVVVQLTAV